MNTKRLTLAIIILLISVVGCRSPNEPVPLRAPGITAPRIASATPTSGTIRIRFAIPQQVHVSMWVSRGIGPGEEGNIQIIHSMGYFFNAGGLSVRTLIDQNLAAGYYEVQWDTRDERGVPVPQGYYRIYLQAENYFDSFDIAVVRN